MHENNNRNWKHIRHHACHLETNEWGSWGINCIGRVSRKELSEERDADRSAISGDHRSWKKWNDRNPMSSRRRKLRSSFTFFQCVSLHINVSKGILSNSENLPTRLKDLGKYTYRSCVRILYEKVCEYDNCHIWVVWKPNISDGHLKSQSENNEGDLDLFRKIGAQESTYMYVRQNATS